ncbi:hypothetical protein CFRS1_v013963 [Colletotrichum fructicola]|nr:hypothetical protein CFRS1_v013963 [Colletotrichum fructicola]
MESKVRSIFGGLSFGIVRQAFAPSSPRLFDLVDWDLYPKYDEGLLTPLLNNLGAGAFDVRLFRLDLIIHKFHETAEMYQCCDRICQFRLKGTGVLVLVTRAIAAAPGVLIFAARILIVISVRSKHMRHIALFEMLRIYRSAFFVRN